MPKANSDSFDKERIASDLRRLGLGAGDLVIVHSSLRAVGRIEPAADAMVEAFMEAIGPDGTLVVPTLIPALRGLRPMFERDVSPSEMGLLTETVRKWPGAARSNHQTHSVAALGPLADEITKDHESAQGPNSPWGPKALGFGSPWEKLYERDAWVLLVGVGFNRCTILHHAQSKYMAAHEGVTKETPWPDFDFTQMGDHLESLGLVHFGDVGNAKCRLSRARSIVNAAVDALETEPDEYFGTDFNDITEWLCACGSVKSRGRPTAAAFKTDITPDAPDRTVGRKLFARGLIVEGPTGTRGALILLDHIGLVHGQALTIRTAICKATGIPVKSILVTASHTHSGYSHCFWPVSGYVEMVAEKAAVAAGDAVGRLEPVRAGWTSVAAPGIRNSRTVYLKDGRAYTERWAMPSTWHIDERAKLRRGPGDDDLRLLVLERLDHSRLAVVANFSCHNSAGLFAEEIQDDFFGVAMEIVEHAEGNDCVTLITPGTQGDQDPTGMIGLGEIRDMRYALRLGRRLAGHILNGTAEVPVLDTFEIATASETSQIRVRDDWRQYGRALGNLEFQKYAEDGVAPAEVCSLTVGEYAMVGIPAEIFTTPGRRLREHSPFEYTSVMALTNGLIGYVPESDAYFEKSYIYGVHPHMADIAEKGTDEILVDLGTRSLLSAKSQASGVLEAENGESVGNDPVDVPGV